MVLYKKDIPPQTKWEKALLWLDGTFWGLGYCLVVLFYPVFRAIDVIRGLIRKVKERKGVR